MNQSEIQKAYDEIRPMLTNGCLFLTSKDAIISKFIRWTDNKASMSHIGMLIVQEFEGEKRVMVIDSNARGVKPEFFSTRLKKIDNFIIIKPTTEQRIIDKSVFDSIDRASKGIKYDFTNGLKEMWNRKGRWFKFKIKPSDDNDICSDYTRQHFIDCIMALLGFKKLRLTFPEDYLRYHNPDTVEIIRAIDYKK